MHFLQLEYCKLQAGCLVLILYLAFIYYKERKRFHLAGRRTLYDWLLAEGIACLLLDGITACTVNHQELVNAGLNLVLHGMFLISIDGLIFLLLLYMLDTTEGLPVQWQKRLLLAMPFLVNVLIVVWNLPTLEYRQGLAGYYSMGISVYTCFAMAAIYISVTIFHVFRCWNSIESHKRINMITNFFVVAGVTGYQMLVPDSLVSGIGTTLLLVGAYVNQENPAMKELSRYHDEMVMGFATLIENRDSSTGGHVKRTTRYVELLVGELKKRGYYSDILSRDYINNLLKAAPMHDIGKIAVPDAVLQKPGRLSPEEFEIMKQHTSRGGEMIQETFGRMGDEQFLEIVTQIARYHHEKWNGRGYPEGLKRKEIPLCARIMAIADVFDAVSADRCYRAALPLEKCFEIIQDGSGQDFDPILAEIFLDLREEVRKVKEGRNETEKYTYRCEGY
ncbi:MAG: HD domain-containing protein [Candidatus Choladocola sp.]|nr:HD domain-containing protein [Candidatus Choladocola sp.]